MSDARTANPSGGYYRAWAVTKGREAAEKSYAGAFSAVTRTLRQHGVEFEPEEVRNFLDSQYGAKMAEEALTRSAVRTQLELRAARFLKHFKQIQRQTRAGAFDPGTGGEGLII